MYTVVGERALSHLPAFLLPSCSLLSQQTLPRDVSKSLSSRVVKTRVKRPPEVTLDTAKYTMEAEAFEAILKLLHLEAVDSVRAGAAALVGLPPSLDQDLDLLALRH